MAGRSVLGWGTVSEYDVDPIVSDSDDGRKTRQTENRALTKRKTKKPNTFTFRVPSPRPSSYQFWIDGEHNGFTTPSQRNFNLRFPWNNFTQDGYLRCVQWPSSPNAISGTRVFVVAKEGTGANIVRAPDTQTKVEGTKIDNELSDLSND